MLRKALRLAINQPARAGILTYWDATFESMRETSVDYHCRLERTNAIVEAPSTKSTSAAGSGTMGVSGCVS